MNLIDSKSKAQDLMTNFGMYGISHNPKKKDGGLEMVLEWQDLVGRSTMGEIVEFWTDLNDKSRELFHFINMNCLDQKTSVEILKQTTLAHSIKLEAERAIRGAKDKITFLAQRITFLEGERDDAEKKVGELEAELTDISDAFNKLSRGSKIQAEDIEHLRGVNADMTTQCNELAIVKKAADILFKNRCPNK